MPRAKIYFNFWVTDLSKEYQNFTKAESEYVQNMSGQNQTIYYTTQMQLVYWFHMDNSNHQISININSETKKFGILTSRSKPPIKLPSGVQNLQILT